MPQWVEHAENTWERKTHSSQVRQNVCSSGQPQSINILHLEPAAVRVTGALAAWRRSGYCSTQTAAESNQPKLRCLLRMLVCQVEKYFYLKKPDLSVVYFLKTEKARVLLERYVQPELCLHTGDHHKLPLLSDAHSQQARVYGRVGRGWMPRLWRQTVWFSYLLSSAWPQGGSGSLRAPMSSIYNLVTLAVPMKFKQGSSWKILRTVSGFIKLLCSYKYFSSQYTTVRWLPNQLAVRYVLSLVRS